MSFVTILLILNIIDKHFLFTLCKWNHMLCTSFAQCYVCEVHSCIVISSFSLYSIPLYKYTKLIDSTVGGHLGSKANFFLSFRLFFRQLLSLPRNCRCEVQLWQYKGDSTLWPRTYHKTTQVQRTMQVSVKLSTNLHLCLTNLNLY